MAVAIQVQNLSKAYQIGQIGTGTISRDIERWVAKLRGKEDPFLKIGEANDRAIKGESDIVWSLKDINFEIQQGDAVGIIGRNGAGKSTLLKLLSRVTSPTTGSIKARGRIASLLEVGTGFHPELTGRENIYLNGAILGMRKKEIDKKLDQIIDFSGVERYVDTPVKRYSSGMYVRLAFAVAAHLESEILIVDEVLAVGDAEFQTKCLGKMNDVSKNEGRTVLFVSHNMQAVGTLCERVILLKNGQFEFDGKTKEGLNIYMSSKVSIIGNDTINEKLKNVVEDDVFDLIGLRIVQTGATGFEFLSNIPITIEFEYRIKKKVVGLRVGFDLIEKSSEITIFRTFHDDNLSELQVLEAGVYKSSVTISENFLKAGTYMLDAAIGIHNVRWIMFDNISAQININNYSGINNLYADERPGIIMPKMVWENAMK
jgi:lipopolysaccharide transport system ATP-binding protein